MSSGWQIVPGGQPPLHCGNGLSAQGAGTHRHSPVAGFSWQIVPCGQLPRHSGNGLCSHRGGGSTQRQSRVAGSGRQTVPGGQIPPHSGYGLSAQGGSGFVHVHDPAAFALQTSGAGHTPSHSG